MLVLCPDRGCGVDRIRTYLDGVCQLSDCAGSSVVQGHIVFVSEVGPPLAHIALHRISTTQKDAVDTWILVDDGLDLCFGHILLDGHIEAQEAILVHQVGKFVGILHRLFASERPVREDHEVGESVFAGLIVAVVELLQALLEGRVGPVRAVTVTPGSVVQHPPLYTL